MWNWMAFLCLPGAAGVLVALSVVDLKVRLLPDKLVFSFALLGVIFHFTTHFQYLSPAGMGFGFLLGAGILYVIRLVANRIYGRDALGLGDVKLMGAAGLWLGPDMVLMALTAGATAGMIHGLGVGIYQARKTRTPLRLSALEVPAGPGFAIGIALVGLYQFVVLAGGSPWPGR
jgi:leader peptidase (prepilin peptidase)/N-methyltransferase